MAEPGVLNPIDEVHAAREEIEAAPDAEEYRVLRRLATNPRNFFAVSFGGGSLHGLAGNCTLAALLEELGLRPHVREVWGTSAGALVGGAWSGGLRSTTILDRLLDGSVGPIHKPSWRHLATSAIRFVARRGLPEGLVPGDRIRAAVERGLPVRSFEECEIPFRAIACTDDGLGRKVVFEKGPLSEAILASMSIPGIFLPIRDWSGGDHGYMDGGIVEKTPLLSIIERHARAARDLELFVLCTHFDGGHTLRSPQGFLQRLVHAVQRAEDVVWTYQLEQARGAPGCKFAVLNPRIEHGGMFEFEMLRFNYLWSRRAFKAQLSNPELPKRMWGR